MKKSDVWDHELVLEFLDLYFKEPVIWHPYHSHHKSRDMHSFAWRRIQSRLSVKFSVPDLKRKKDSLMASYRAAGQAIRKAHRNGDKDYKPSWFAYPKMEKYLKKYSREDSKPHVVALQTSSANDVDENSFNEEDAEAEDGSDDAYSDNDSNSSLVKVKNEDDESYFKSEDMQAPASSSKKRKVREHDARERDEIDLFLELLRSKMRRMDEKTRDVAMNKIDNLMFEIKMEVPQEQPMLLYESLVNVDAVEVANSENDEKQDKSETSF